YRGNRNGKPGNSLAEAIACEAQSSRLRRLNLAEVAFDDTGARALASSKHLGSLRSLALGNNFIGDEGVKALSTRESGLSKNIFGVTLGSNRVTERGVEAITSSFDNLVVLFVWVHGWQMDSPTRLELKAKFGEGMSG